VLHPHYCHPEIAAGERGSTRKTRPRLCELTSGGGYLVDVAGRSEGQPALAFPLGSGSAQQKDDRVQLAADYPSSHLSPFITLHCRSRILRRTSAAR
jgi:hypothetical protein